MKKKISQKIMMKKLSIRILKMLGNKKGFSLMEMLVVVMIVGVLTSIAHVSYSTYRKKARKFDAKKTLGTIITVAEAFKANAGFYLPNLGQMHVPLKGKLEYSYVIACPEGVGTNVNWGNDATKACGSFTTDAGQYTSPLTPPSVSAIANCWMGYVLYQAVRFHHPNMIVELLPTDNFPCENTLTLSMDYPYRDSLTSVVSLPMPNYTVQTDDNTALTSAKTDFFTIQDSRHICGTRVEYDEDVFHQSASCFSVKEYAVHESKVQTLITDVVSNHSDVEQTYYLSSPMRLSVSALACSEEDEDDCGTGSLQSQEYHIITLDSRKILKIYSGTANL